MQITTGVSSSLGINCVFSYARRCHRIHLIAVLASCLVASVLSADAESAVRLMPGQNLSAVVNQAPPGTTFVFSAGTYRLNSIVPKVNDVFLGEGTVILSGAKILEMRQDYRGWSAAASLSTWPEKHCAATHPLCWVLSDLFIDDHLQTPVETLGELGPGRWYYDAGSGKVYISTNPAGHTVELGTTAAAFSGQATGVQISHLIVERYASPPEHGAVGGDNGSARGWLISNVEARWNHGSGIAVGPGSRIEGCNSHHNGEAGLSGHGANITVQDTEVAYNNLAGYDIGWGGGGAKFSDTTNLVLRSNYVHDNLGDGLWTDIDNKDTLYEKNRFINNQRAGIHHEISYDATIRDNLFKGNRVGILIVLSSNVEVYGNVIEVPRNGIEGIRIATGQRGSGIYGAHLSHDDYVHNNIIVCLGPNIHDGASGPLVDGANIRFDYNEYHFAGGGQGHFIWGNNPLSISEMRKIGMCQHSTVKTDLPAEPDPTR